MEITLTCSPKMLRTNRSRRYLNNQYDGFENPIEEALLPNRDDSEECSWAQCSFNEVQSSRQEPMKTCMNRFLLTGMRA